MQDLAEAEARCETGRYLVKAEAEVEVEAQRKNEKTTSDNAMDLIEA